MEEDKIIDQSELAESIAEKIPYEFIDMFLVKPLDPIKVSKEVSTPVATEEKTDENGIQAADYKDVKTEVVEMDSEFRKGVVIKIPSSYAASEKDDDFKLFKIKVGDIVVFRDASTRYFDIVKDTKLLRYYDIFAVQKDDRS